MSAPLVAYVAGPYRGPNDSVVDEHIVSARAVAKTLWAAGFAVICPHSNSAFMSGVTDEDDILEGYKTILLRCDLVVLAPGWEQSHGTHEEVLVAAGAGIPVGMISYDEADSVEIIGITEEDAALLEARLG